MLNLPTADKHELEDLIYEKVCNFHKYFLEYILPHIQIKDCLDLFKKQCPIPLLDNIDLLEMIKTQPKRELVNLDKCYLFYCLVMKRIIKENKLDEIITAILTENKFTGDEKLIEEVKQKVNLYFEFFNEIFDN